MDRCYVQGKPHTGKHEGVVYSKGKRANGWYKGFQVVNGVI